MLSMSQKTKTSINNVQIEMNKRLKTESNCFNFRHVRSSKNEPELRINIY